MKKDRKGEQIQSVLTDFLGNDELTNSLKNSIYGNVEINDILYHFQEVNPMKIKIKKFTKKGGKLMKLNHTEQEKSGILPPDVLGIIDYYISYKLDKGLSKVGEGYFLPLPFVSVLKMILRDNGIPCDYEEQLPEPCRCQISNIVWDNVDEIIRMSKKFQEEQKEEN